MPPIPITDLRRIAEFFPSSDFKFPLDPTFEPEWNIIQEIESKTVGKRELIMTPLLQSSLDEAREEGMRKGRLAGKKEGRQEGQKELILNMLKEKANLAFISKVTGLSVKKLKKLKNSDSE